MRYNGTLRYETVTDGGIDEWGEPIGAKAEWSEPIPCSIKTNSDTRKGKYEDGKFRQASFTVLVELQNIAFDRVRLERQDEPLGDFNIISVEPLTSVGRIQIVV